MEVATINFDSVRVLNVDLNTQGYTRNGELVYILSSQIVSGNVHATRIVERTYLDFQKLDKFLHIHNPGIIIPAFPVFREQHKKARQVPILQDYLLLYAQGVAAYFHIVNHIQAFFVQRYGFDIEAPAKKEGGQKVPFWHFQFWSADTEFETERKALLRFEKAAKYLRKRQLRYGNAQSHLADSCLKMETALTNLAVSTNLIKMKETVLLSSSTFQSISLVLRNPLSPSKGSPSSTVFNYYFPFRSRLHRNIRDSLSRRNQEIEVLKDMEAETKKQVTKMVKLRGSDGLTEDKTDAAIAKLETLQAQEGKQRNFTSQMTANLHADLEAIDNTDLDMTLDAFVQASLECDQRILSLYEGLLADICELMPD